MSDIEMAQMIVSNKYLNSNKDIYNNDSFIFITTNEKINFYEEYLKNKSKVLSVTSSGDQILNTILNNSLNIDSFDISRFPKYFTELKIAAIKDISLDEYIDMFFKASNDKNEYYDDLYYSFRKNLDSKDKKFWDNLLGFYDWTEILESRLFSSQTVSLASTIRNNPYLKEENFDKLKKNLNNTNINYYISNVIDIQKITNNKYDLVNLSSIIYYVYKYKEILESFNLTTDGSVLTYLYSTDEFKKYYTECSFIDFDNCSDGVMIYKKNKRV